MMWSARRNSSGKFRLGVSGKMILNVAAPTAIVLFGLAVIVTVIVVNTVWSLKDKDIKNQMEAVSNQVVQYFESFFAYEKFIGDYDSVKQLLAEMEQSPPAYRFETSELYQRVLRDLQYADSVGGDTVQGVWLAGVKNNQAIRSDGYVTGSAFDITGQLWYQLLEQNPGFCILTPAYEDTATGQLVITAVTPYTDPSGNIISVIGIDLSLDALMDYFRQIRIGETGYITVFDSEQNIIYHPDSSIIMRNLDDGGYVESLKELLKNQENSDVGKYQYGGTTYYGGIRFISLYYWTVLACMPESEYMQETVSIFLILLVGFLVCIVITALVCLFRTRALIKPLKRIGLVAENFAQGNLDSGICRKTNDEIGDLEEIFSTTQVNLKQIITDIAVVLQGISNKDLTVKTSAVYPGDFRSIQDSLQGITAAMNDTMSQVHAAASHIDAGAAQVSTGAQSLAQSTSEQASSVEGLLEAAQKISDKIDHTANQAEAAKNQTLAAKDSLTESDQKMQKLVAAMNQIKDTSSQVQEIIKTIDDIAFQTNILALNAAVEAARGGSAGKGFAIVADEVRSLAGKAAEASRTTQELVQASIEAVKEGNALLEDTAKALDETAANASLAMESIVEIAKASMEEAASVNRITLGLDQISSVVQTNAATAEESAASSEELSGQASLLEHLLAQFKIS